MRTAIACVMTLASIATASGLAAAAGHQRATTGAPADAAASADATRRALVGTWTLTRLEVIGTDSVRLVAQSRGTLTYDTSGRLAVSAVVDDARLTRPVVLDYTGRIVIDAAKHQFAPADVESDRPADPSRAAPVSLDKIRRYELTGDRLVVTYLDALGKATAVAFWSRASR